MNNIIKIPQLQALGQNMSKEMMKAGIIEEMVDDAFEALDDDDIEEEAEEQVNAILWEVQLGINPATNDLNKKELDDEEKEAAKIKAQLDDSSLSKYNTYTNKH